MAIHKLLLMIVVLGPLSAPYHHHITEAADWLTKPGCPTTCGNLSIPYPFGLMSSSSDCHINHPSFIVDCDDSNGPPVPYMAERSSNIEILDIFVEDHEMRVNALPSRACHNDMGSNESSSIDPRFNQTYFPISSTKNKFIAVGCDTAAFFLGRDGEFSFGCMSWCGDFSRLSDGPCSGIGCCDKDIPRGSFGNGIFFGRFNSHCYVLERNPCSYAFVAEIGSYNFSVSDLKQLKFNQSTLVLDWAVGNQTCKSAKNKNNYMCTDNTDCTDAENGPGYKCTCKIGYEGNPYLENGCHDIDECADPKMNACGREAECHNTEGNYTCSCPKGYHGDGKDGGDGLGCIANPKSSHLVMILVGVGTVIGTIVLLLLCWWLFKHIKRRRVAELKRKYFERNGGFLLQQRLSSIKDTHMERGKLFTSTELDRATDHFNKNRILGQGGQGTVYKGMLIDGTIIAIKKSKVIDIKQVEQFINEAVILSEINHRNVVKLLGFCLESEVPLLVYEFVPNGTLYQYLHDPAREFHVSWEMRLRIANEVARALSYLHSDAAIPIYHRDIKSSNILLDKNYRAKVADFGTSRSIPIDQTHLTTKVRGTVGYLDPEYYQTHKITDKSDVYSFGVVLVELLTGQKPISESPSGECRNLASYFIISMDENRLFDILDKEVLEHGEEEEILAVSKLAKRCLGLHGRHRPTMKEVVMQLEQVRSLQNPKVVQQYEEEINHIRIGSIYASCVIPMPMQLETQVKLTSVEEDQSILSPR